MKKSMKKKVIIIGGNSSKNNAWVQRAAKIYTPTYDVIPFSFSHWETDQTDIDFKWELQKLVKIVAAYDEYFIVAKSAGALLALMGIHEKVIKPAALIVMGLPLNYAAYRDMDIANLYENVTTRCPSLIIQQAQDPEGSAADVKSLLPTIPIIRIEGRDHSYDELMDVKRYVDDFIHLRRVSTI